MKNLKSLEIIGAILVIVSSFLFHFIFEWSGKNPAVGLISAVNESVWEHIKIIFFPYLIFSIFEYFILRPNFCRFVVSKTAGLIFIILALIVFFYTYSGIIGQSIVIIDILSAVIWSILSFIVSYKLYTSSLNIEKLCLPSLIISLTLILCLFIFTFNPPKIPLFQDSITGKYGILY